MNKEEIRSKIIDCFLNIGIIIMDSDLISDSFNIQDYMEDSVMFITFVIELENVFDIEIPDEYLAPETINTLPNLVELIDGLMK